MCQNILRSYKIQIAICISSITVFSHSLLSSILHGALYCISLHFQQLCRFRIRPNAVGLYMHSFTAENQSDFYVFFTRYSGTMVLTLHILCSLHHYSHFKANLLLCQELKFAIAPFHPCFICSTHILCFTNADNVFKLKSPNNSFWYSAEKFEGVESIGGQRYGTCSRVEMAQ